MTRMKLHFLGAAGTVTGSKYLVEDNGKRYLIDCGLFQGRKDLRDLNWDAFPVDPASIAAVVLTHAHIDHTGYLPLLVKKGFNGPVYCSAATQDLCKILLPDSGRIQEEDADSANRHGYSQHDIALPLYTEDDAHAALGHLHAVPFGQPQMLDDEISFTLHRAGHILGAASITLRLGDGTTVVFSGDIGRDHDPVIKPPAHLQDADYLLVESTYGDRSHPQDDPMEAIGAIIHRTIARGGSVLIPAFAVGRAQALMYYIYKLKEAGKIPAHLPVFLDSPMAVNASELLQKHLADHRLPLELCRAVCDGATYVGTPTESKALDENIVMPKVIISASGMLTGGRILHHLKYYLGDPRHTVLLAGFQADGTRGQALARGDKEIKIHGALWPVKAEIALLDTMSAHADREGLLRWLSHFRVPPRRTFIVHGEKAAAHALCDTLTGQLGWSASVPDYLESVDI